ncbi:DUF6624 domain-containing protein [Streptomyces sp. NPDC050732]|uniref:DUF6624 domain-containing protein n=1 Tax=Streptomyces sp. NPDC050732 TaxID=3154632 RepID=UPI003449E706
MGALVRPDLARTLLDRAAEGRSYRGSLMRGLLDEVQISRGRHLEHANTQVLQRIVAAHEWPDAHLVGAEAAEAAWWIALHADHLPDFQRSALRLIRAAADSGTVSRKQWAHMHDRCSVRRDAAQTYGTQYQYGPTGIERLPVWDPVQLDVRRAGVGLGPAAEALDHLRRRLSVGAVQTGVVPHDDTEATNLDRRVAA